MKRSLETVKSRPILMQAESVRAIIEGRKTQTRRVVKPQPIRDSRILRHPDGGDGWAWKRLKHLKNPFAIYEYEWVSESQTNHILAPHCPYGGPADFLWVKETWGIGQQCKDGPDIWYKATEERCAPMWKSSLFMPRAYSRITLLICSVRVERLQDISEEDAYAEGCLAVCGPGMAVLKNCREVYRDLWESIHGKGAWERNDWVWVIDFRRITL